MRFNPQFLDDLRSRVTVSSVVGRRVRLIRKGREYQGLCPFHNEKTPSFTVNDMKGFYHCFGCGAHGDAIRFLTDSVGMGYVEAVTQLAQEVGLPLPKPDKKAAEREQQAATLYEVLELACSYYQAALRSHDARHAREYLKNRGITEDIIQHFRLGFAPNHYTSLQTALKQKGITEGQMRAVGLLSEKEGKAAYDKFRNRIIFPITDVKGRVVAFGGRILGDGAPKYLNSPETELFKKGEMLYNLSQAKEAAYQTQAVVVAEGYMDVIALYKAGITHAVAPLGTAITGSQLTLLWKYANEPVLCLDGDTAGKRAMVRAAVLALPLLKPGYSLSFALLPKGMDPDDIVRKEGAQAIRRYLADTLPLCETLWRVESAHKRVTPEQKAALEQKLKSYVAGIKDKTVQTYYYRYFNEKLWHWSRVKPGKNGDRKPDNVLRAVPAQINQVALCEQAILALILTHPALLLCPEVEEELSHTQFASESLDNLCTAILEIKNFTWTEGNNGLSSATLIQHLENRGFVREVSQCTGKQHVFLGEFLTPGIAPETVLLGWKRAVLLRNLALMENERQAMLMEVTDEAQQKAVELTKQMETLKKLLQTAESV